MGFYRALTNTFIDLPSKISSHFILSKTRLKNPIPSYHFPLKDVTIESNSSLHMTLHQQLVMQILELTKSLHLANSLLQHSVEAIAGLDKALNVQVLNHSFNNLFFNIFDVKIQKGMNLSEVLTYFPEFHNKIVAVCQEALQSNKSSLILESENINEKYYCYEIFAYQEQTQAAHPIELIFCIRDLTQFKLQERRQHMQQASIMLSCRKSAMKEMAGAFAHEVNQPLTAILAYSRASHFILNNKLPTQVDKLDNSIEQIIHQAELAGEIISHMKNLVSQDNFYVEQTDLNKLIQETISILNYEKRDFDLKIILNLAPEIPQIMTNKTHIMQVILNLVRNSMEALQSIEKTSPQVWIKTDRLRDFLIVHIQDNGPGISAEHFDKILHNFTTKPQGKGIGLSICRSLIEAHGGKLRIHPDAKEGAWLSFTLPITQVIHNDKISN